MRMSEYCLSKQELARFIEIELQRRHPYDEETDLRSVLDGWRNWQVNLMCLATSFSEILEQLQKQGMDVYPVLKWMYSLSQETGIMVIEEFDETFVTYIFRYERQHDLSIDENLVHIRGQLSEYIYPRISG